MIEESAPGGQRMERSSLCIWASLTDLMNEADYWANKTGHEHIGRDDVQAAIKAQVRRGRPSCVNSCMKRYSLAPC